MNNIINQPTVLVLNRGWQAIHVKTPAQAFCMMATDVATALDIERDGQMRPVKWAEWLTLPVREQDSVVHTPRGQVRVPTVIVLAKYARVPQKRPKFSSRAIWSRDAATCQYTGHKLAPNEGNIDHVVPRSRGGKTSWENCVLAHKQINSRKADRLPEECGMKPLRPPAAPKALPTTLLIRNEHQLADWEFFLRQK